MKKTTIGLIVGTRGFFPASLAEKGRKIMIRTLEARGFDVRIPGEEETPFGAVETLADARCYGRFFRGLSEEIQGLVVTLPNFGDEIGIIETIERSGLKVPILVHAWDDRTGEMDMARRRDSFCGKLSVCNNLYQHGIPFTNTTLHTCPPDSPEFLADLDRFAGICRVVSGLRGARLGAIGQRPDAFATVRFSEKLLQASGITVSTVDLSEIIEAARGWNDEEAVRKKLEEMAAYGPVVPGTPAGHLRKSACLSLAVEAWIQEKQVDASAIQCWDSIQKNYGCATCLTMSMLGEKGSPSACETDVMGALSMYALQLASGEPSGFLDWNNNFDDQRDMCVNIHCSNYPKSFIGGGFEIGNLDILGASLGEDRCFGALKTRIAPGPMTFARVSTDDVKGTIKVYVGEGEFRENPLNTVGGSAVCRVDNLQGLLNYMCENGFEHHVAMNRGLNGEVLAEALGKYMGWQVYHHKS